ncbi:MAG: acyl-CoA synthetase [Salinirussus sp.]
MQLGYESYAEAKREFTWAEAWELVDGTPDAINACHECLDRHDGTATRIKYSDGSSAEHSFEELSTAAGQFANLLADRGVTSSDRIAIMLDPSKAFLTSFFGTMKHGAGAIPCSELFGPDALEYRLRDSGATALVTSTEVLETIDTDLTAFCLTKEELDDSLAGYESSYEADTSGDSEAWVQYTSGTTGRPEAVPYDHASVANFAPVMDFIMDFEIGDSCFTTSSTGWGTGIWIGTFAPLVLGIPNGYYSGAFDPRLALDAIEEFNVNALLGIVPTAYRKMIEAMEAPVTVEKANYLGEPIDPDLSREVESTFGAFPRALYGVTEVRSIITIDYGFPDYDFKHGSMGKPLLGIEVTVVDEDGTELPADEIGYIAVRRSDEWITTSDAGYYDEEGYFWSAGRMDDTIISAGYTIGPQEVEDTLRTHPAVREAGVIGIPDEDRGEVVKAYLEVTPSGDDDLAEDIRRYVREELSKHEYPREIEFVDEVPRTPDGKIQRARLRDREGL